MKLDKLGYVDKAERTVSALDTDNYGNPRLTTSKIRGLLSMVSELYTDAQHAKAEELSPELCSRVQYLRMRIAYEAGRDGTVKDFVQKAELLPCIAEIGANRERLLLFCNYMEALVAYHKFNGGRDA